MAKSRPSEQPSQPSRKDFLKNDRSKAIRETCIGILKGVDALLHDPQVAQDDDAQQRVYGELESLNGKLIELGIKPHMHVGAPQEKFQDPVTMAEYVAGQIYSLTGESVVSETGAMPAIKEYSEQKVEGDEETPTMHVVKNEGKVPKKMKDFMVARSMVNAGIRFLDADEEMSDKQEEDDE